jgi:UDP-glucose 4-epimerase
MQIAKKTPLFPLYRNSRSMIYIENLCEFIRLLVENGDSGLFYPQEKEYICTSNLIKAIAVAHGKKIWMTAAFNQLIRLFSGKALVKKVFGNLAYDQAMSEYEKGEYRIYSFKESIERTISVNTPKEVN